jgi:mono/diheme cytochrome c family protein
VTTMDRRRPVLFSPSLFSFPFVSLSLAAALSLLLAAATLAEAQTGKSQRSSEAGSTTGDVARGKYLVEGVAMCGQCHTPRDANGNPDRSRWLQGAAVPWLPAKRDPNWPLNAPRIGGNPPARDEDMVKLLTAGVWTSGNRLRAPMPQFRMERADAEAVVAYLKSVTPQQ